MYSFALVLLRPVQYPPPPPPFARRRAVSPDIALLGASETQLTSLLPLFLSLSRSRSLAFSCLGFSTAGLRANKFHRAYLPRQRNPLCRGTADARLRAF